MLSQQYNLNQKIPWEVNTMSSYSMSIDIERCGMNANETTLHPSCNL